MRRKYPSSHPTAESILSLFRTGMSITPGDELILRHFQLRDGVAAKSQGRPHLVDELLEQGHRSLVSVLQLRDMHSFRASEPPGICRCTQRACERPGPGKNTSATVGSRPIFTAAPWIAGPAQQGRRAPDQWNATGESQWSAALDQGKQPLRHDRDADDLNMRNNGHINPAQNAQFETVHTCLCSITAMSTTLSRN